MSLNSRAQSYDLGSASTVTKTGTQRSKPTNYRKMTIVLAVVSLVLLIISIVFITLYAIKVNSQKSSDEPGTLKPGTAGKLILVLLQLMKTTTCNMYVQ